MGNLHDCYDPNWRPGDGSDYLDAGWHTVTIRGFENGESKVKKTPYVRFQMEADGKKAHDDFYLTPNAMPRLALFAKFCGLNDAEMRVYDPEANSNCHTVLVNRRVRINWQLQEGSDKYHEVVEFASPGTTVSSPPMQSPMPTAHEANATTKDDIPF